MDIMNLTEDDLVDGAEVLGAMEFMEMAEDAQVMFIWSVLSWFEFQFDTWQEVPETSCQLFNRAKQSEKQKG